MLLRCVMHFSAAFFTWALWVLLALAVQAEAASDTNSQNETAQLTIKPNKCIALHKGTNCYQTINFYWRTPQEGDFCLFVQNQEQPLHCWQGNGAVPFRYEFVGHQGVQFTLRSKQSELLASAEFTVAWVYNSGKRDAGGWRLF